MWHTIKAWWKSPFPFYLNSDRDNLLMVLGVSAFILFFLLTFRPFGLAAQIPEPEAPYVFSGIALGVLLLHVLLVPRLASRYFDDSSWTLGGFALYNLWIIAVVGVFSASYGHYVLGDGCQDTFLQHLFAEQFRALTIGIIPVSGILGLIHNRMLVRNLHDVETVNRSLDLRRNDGLIRRPLSEPGSTKQEKPWMIQSDTQEQLELPDGSMLYAEADDNYSRIHWLQDGQVQDRLLRLTLKNLEEQLPVERVARVHRSFIANLERVDELRGNASGYRLYYAPANAEIPVARTRSRDVLEMIDSKS